MAINGDAWHRRVSPDLPKCVQWKIEDYKDSAKSRRTRRRLWMTWRLVFEGKEDWKGSNAVMRMIATGCNWWGMTLNELRREASWTFNELFRCCWQITVGKHTGGFALTQLDWWTNCLHLPLVPIFWWFRDKGLRCSPHTTQRANGALPSWARARVSRPLMAPLLSCPAASMRQMRGALGPRKLLSPLASGLWLLRKTSLFPSLYLFAQSIGYFPVLHLGCLKMVLNLPVNPIVA